MPRTSIVNTPGKIWIPQYRFALNWLIKITKEDGTEYDVTDYVLNAEVQWPVTDSLASCTLTLDNDEGRYLDIFNGGEKIEIWGEYSATPGVPVYKIYRGKLDNILYSLTTTSGYIATVNSRQVPEANDILIVEQFDNQQTSEAIKFLVDKYLSGLVTVTNVTDSDTRVTTNFRHIPVWKAIKDLLQRSDYDGYIDTDMDLNTFDEETLTTTKDTIVVGDNLLNSANYGKNNNDIKNKILVYGKEDNNLLLLKTEEDTTSEADLWEKTLVITDSALTTSDEVQDKANLELSLHTSFITPGGSFSILGSPQLLPGYMIQSSVPYCGISGTYKMKKISHNLSSNGFTTTLDISRQEPSMSTLFKERIDAESRLSPVSNLNYMENSYYFNFDETSAPWALSNCSVTAGGDNSNILSLNTGQALGICEFSEKSTDKNITQCELRIHSNWPETENDTYQVSNDGGYTWANLNPGVLYNFTTTGNKIRYRIVLNSDASHNPTYEGICLLYK